MTWKIWRKVFLFFYVRELPPLLFPVHATSRLYSPTIHLYLPLSSESRLMVWVHYWDVQYSQLSRLTPTLWKPRFQRSVSILLYSPPVVFHIMLAFGEISSPNRSSWIISEKPHQLPHRSVWFYLHCHMELLWSPQQHPLHSTSDMDVIVFQEHWLWPFKRHILQSISDQYSFTLVCDNRLNPLSDLCHGCGGVAILWKKCLAKCHPFPSIWKWQNLCH